MIITISREFGSGGRELGKRLSDALSIPCYDKEIITLIAKEHGFDENYVAHVSEKKLQAAYPHTIGRHFATTENYVTKQAVKIAVEQRKIIERFAGEGSCIIVGRCADVILREHAPFNIFVYASREAKLLRCAQYAPADEKLTAAQLERKMREIDRNRAAYRDFYADTKWGAKENYHLCVNTTGVEIKEIVPHLASYISVWFSREQDAK